MNQLELRTSLANQANTVVAGTPGQFGKFIGTEIVQWKRGIEEAKTRID